MVFAAQECHLAMGQNPFFPSKATTKVPTKLGEFTHPKMGFHWFCPPQPLVLCSHSPKPTKTRPRFFLQSIDRSPCSLEARLPVLQFPGRVLIISSAEELSDAEVWARGIPMCRWQFGGCMGEIAKQQASRGSNLPTKRVQLKGPTHTPPCPAFCKHA